MNDTDVDRFRRRIDRLRARLSARAPDRAGVAAFRRLVLGFYERHGRDLPWRRTTDPYRVLVSEIMLQQTQVPRVEVKYREFLEVFPDVRALAAARRDELLRVWQGLGYNRRAVALQRTAQAVCERADGALPDSYDQLLELPGIGPATAADIVVFAHDRPALVVETNIRAVFILLFFPPGAAPADRELVPLIERTMDRRRPRRWYNALMDLGVFVKRAYGNPARRSPHHVRQSRFEGSNRQLRSRILKALLACGPATAAGLARALATTTGDVERNLRAMAREGLLSAAGARYTVA